MIRPRVKIRGQDRLGPGCDYSVGALRGMRSLVGNRVASRMAMYVGRDGGPVGDRDS